jgi:hypothetical protein
MLRDDQKADKLKYHIQEPKEVLSYEQDELLGI